MGLGRSYSLELLGSLLKIYAQVRQNLPTQPECILESVRWSHKYFRAFINDSYLAREHTVLQKLSSREVGCSKSHIANKM